MEIENQVQLANIAKVSVEYLHKVMDHVQNYKLVVVLLNTGCEVQAGISLEHYFVFTPFQEVREATWPPNNHSAYL